MACFFPDFAFWFPDVLKMTLKTQRIMAGFVPIPNASEEKKKGDHLESVKQTDLCFFLPSLKADMELQTR